MTYFKKNEAESTTKHRMYTHCHSQYIHDHQEDKATAPINSSEASLTKTQLHTLA